MCAVQLTKTFLRASSGVDIYIWEPLFVGCVFPHQKGQVAWCHADHTGVRFGCIDGFETAEARPRCVELQQELCLVEKKLATIVSAVRNYDIRLQQKH